MNISKYVKIGCEALDKLEVGASISSEKLDGVVVIELNALIIVRRISLIIKIGNVV